jgi:hypothetical protein
MGPPLLAGMLTADYRMETSTIARLGKVQKPTMNTKIDAYSF